MAPEYSKAALGLHPLVPLYAVDCDAENNKRLCGEQVRITNELDKKCHPMVHCIYSGSTRIPYC